MLRPKKNRLHVPKVTREVRKWKLKDLKPHPRQAELFPDLHILLLRDLAQDMEARGLKEPLEILPDGTIVCGHQRKRAAELNGWDEIDVWVNHELAKQGPLAVEQRLIEDNLVGRKLDRLDQVRCYRRLVEMAPDTPAEQRRDHQHGRLRDIIGDRLGISGRTLERYLRVLETPAEVQDAFRAGRISLVNASKVAGLPLEVQQQLAADLRAGTDPKQAVAASLAGREPDPFEAVFGPFLRGLARYVPAVQPQADRITKLAPGEVAVLQDARALIGQLLRQAKGAKPTKRRGRPPKGAKS
jgi:ParB-like chromosome segregation protein Spo0J